MLALARSGALKLHSAPLHRSRGCPRASWRSSPGGQTHLALASNAGVHGPHPRAFARLRTEFFIGDAVAIKVAPIKFHIVDASAGAAILVSCTLDRSGHDKSAG